MRLTYVRSTINDSLQRLPEGTSECDCWHNSDVTASSMTVLAHAVTIVEL